MRRLIVVLALWPSLAIAQQPQTIALPAPLAGHILPVLQGGGTFAEAQSLAQQVIDVAQEPGKEAARKAAQDKAIADAVAAAKAPAEPEKK